MNIRFQWTAACMVVLAGCGGGSSSAPSTGSAAATTPTAPTTPVSSGPYPTPSGPRTDVTTYKNDLGRSGVNATESILTLSNVNSSSFGVLRNVAVDGKSVATAAGGANVFAPGQYAERASLLLSNGSIYVSFTSHCDAPPYSGWIMSYAQSTLAQTSVLNVAPNSNAGPSIWMSGGGPAADAAGNVYLLTANGAFETTLDAQGFPSKGDYGNAFLKIANSAGVLSVADYFALTNTVAESNADRDLGSGGALVLPDVTDSSNTVQHLVVGAGKDGNIYLVNRDSMGKFSAGGNNIYQQLTGALPGGVFSTPAFFNSTLYYADIGGSLKAFPLVNAKLSSTPQSQSALQFTYPGSAPAVSANGTTNAIVWAHENTNPAVLHAYDATNLTHELYNSSQAGSRDQFGAGNKYITPTIADGLVFVGTTSSVAIFGLLSP